MVRIMKSVVFNWTPISRSVYGNGKTLCSTGLQYFGVAVQNAGGMRPMGIMGGVMGRMGCRDDVVQNELAWCP